jgi:hypothetical protein
MFQSFGVYCSCHLHGEKNRGCSIICRSHNGSEGGGRECGAIQWKEAMGKYIKLVMVVECWESEQNGVPSRSLLVMVCGPPLTHTFKGGGVRHSATILVLYAVK